MNLSLQRKSIIVCAALAFTTSCFAVECEDIVDMADSLKFNQMHTDCGKAKDDADISEKPITEKPLSISSSSSSTSSSTVGVNGEVLYAKEPFSLTGGPLSAETLLFQAMAQSCPKGWEILRQSVTLNGKDAEMQYQYTCL